MDFSLKTLMHAIIGGGGWGLALSGFVLLLFPAITLTPYVINCGVVTGGTLLSALYLFAVWRAS
ncbi:hypothetical protein K6L24_08365 [Erwinia persicina]|uniref:hypothetical protein n=1 Tax=Erwinia persicina TaxID=55211 RepID=UPI001C9A51C8|nr:hypothetical protein [Erwinia persicina]QZQ51759.1 hypothetical protein K6L24_08365 [Erwinia persicina]